MATKRGSSRGPKRPKRGIPKMGVRRIAKARFLLPGEAMVAMRPPGPIIVRKTGKPKEEKPQEEKPQEEKPQEEKA